MKLRLLGLDSRVSQALLKVQLVTIPSKLVTLRTLPKVRCQQLIGLTKLSGNNKGFIMSAGAKHYFKDGKEHKGAVHKDASGKLMSGAKHTASSKYLVHTKKKSNTSTKTKGK